jgi:hypothetical protein
MRDQSVAFEAREECSRQARDQFVAQIDLGVSLARAFGRGDARDSNFSVVQMRES